MSLTFRTVNFFVKGLTRLVCKVEDEQLAQVPKTGPFILVCNHVNFVEVPLMFTHLQPRQVTGFTKVESWDNPAMAWLMNLWEAIPIHRGEADTEALRQGLKVLDEGKILTITPEGTRTGTGILQRGHPGVVVVALRSGVPLQPLVYYGHENYSQNLKKLRRTEFHIRVGNPFRLRALEGKIKSEIRQEITDEIMYQLASLLPEMYRGVYADLSKATTKHLIFEGVNFT
jgi:1-acyl-sn-glycerol-3-phosphate acyltransferase